MAEIATYPAATQPYAGTEKLLGSQGSGNTTSNFTLASIAQYAGGSLVFTNVAAMVANSIAAASLPSLVAYVRGYTNFNDGGEGVFILDLSDTTTTTDHGMVFVDGANNRWKRPIGTPISVRWFGAQGNLSNDDTSAFQYWWNYLIANQAYVASGTANASRGYIPNGRYKITGSLNFTFPNSGATVAGVTITGDDQNNTIIYDELADGAYPVIDGTNWHDVHISDLSILQQTGSLSSCGLLFAQDRNSSFITYNNRISRVSVIQLTTAANAVAAVVQQNSDLVVYDEVNYQGVIGLSVGWRLPVQHSGTAQSGSTSTTLKLDSGASSVNNFYNGYPLRLTHGTGAGSSPVGTPVIAVITAYNGSTKVATVDITWPNGTPDNTTTFEIYAIKSKYKVPQSHDDITVPLVRGQSTIGGKQAVLMTGIPGVLNLSDTYVVAQNGLTSDASVILLGSQPPNDNLGPFDLLGRGINIENQSGITPITLVKNAGPGAVSAYLEGRLLGAENAGSAILADTASQGFQTVELNGTAYDAAAVFNVGGYITQVSGGLYTQYPGTVTGGIYSWTLDWQNSSWDSNFQTFILANVLSPALTTYGMIVPTQPLHAPMGQVNASYSAFINLSPSGAYTGGSGNQNIIGFPFPANMLLPGPGGNLRSAHLHSGFTVSANMTAIAVNVAQTSTSINTNIVSGLTASTGNIITLDLYLRAYNATSIVVSGTIIINGTVTQIESGYISVAANAVWSINIYGTSASNNPLSYTVYTLETGS